MIVIVRMFQKRGLCSSVWLERGTHNAKVGGSSPPIAIVAVYLKMIYLLLAGRPNVGKSSIFNLLTSGRHALVLDQEGVTQESHTRLVKRLPYTFYCIDTPGMVQHMSCSENVTHIWWITDGQQGWSDEDAQAIAKLRTFSKPIWLLVNKSEKKTSERFNSYRSGLEPHFVSTYQPDTIYKMLPITFGAAVHSPEKQAVKLPKFSFVGKPNVGKSSLVNALSQKTLALVADQPGTTIDSIEWPYQDWLLTDTAGLRRRTSQHTTLETFAALKALEHMQRSTAAVLVLDMTNWPISKQELLLAHALQEKHIPYIIAFNKCDKVSDANVFKVAKQALAHLNAFQMITVSAIHGRGLSSLKHALKQILIRLKTTLTTSMLNQALRTLKINHPSPHHVAIKFARPDGHHLGIVLQGNGLDRLPRAYQQYLLKGFQQALGLTGIPITITYQITSNPYHARNV
jgi:GTPase